MGMIEAVGAIVFVAFVLGMLLAVFGLMFSDTATFQAIDEKIAEWIRGGSRR